jgi:hypothetical protein
VTDAFRCGTETIIEAARCGTKWVKSAHHCGTEWVTSAAECGSEAVTEVARCGQKSVESATQCGEESLTSIERCGKSVSKVCDSRRRRRCCGWVGLLTCNFEDVAKSCKVPKTCMVPQTCTVPKGCDAPKTCSVPNSCEVAKSCPKPKSCNLAQPFGDCLSSMSREVGAAGQIYMNFVGNTGCTSAAACKAKVLAGLEESAAFVGARLQDRLESLMSTITGKVATGTAHINTATQAASEETDRLIESAKGIADKVLAYLTRTFDGFQKFSLGDVCSADGTGIWYMMPTDCGAFDAMQSIFNSLENAASAWTTALSGFKTCIAKTGIWQTPMPFFDLKIERVCLPQPIVTGMEYLLGSIVYAAAVAQTLVGDIQAVVAPLRAWIESKLNLQSLGGLFQQLSTSANATSVLEAGSMQAPGCGPNPTWAVRVTITVGITFPAVSGNYAVSLGISIALGCKDGMLLPPNLLLTFGDSKVLLPMNDPKKLKPPSVSPSLTLGFQNGYPAFVNRVAFAAGLTIKPSVVIKGVKVAVPLTFGVLPDPTQPPSFFAVTLSLSPPAPPPGLAQLATRVNEASEVAGRYAGPKSMRQCQSALVRGPIFLCFFSPWTPAGKVLVCFLGPYKAGFDEALKQRRLYQRRGFRCGHDSGHGCCFQCDGRGLARRPGGHRGAVG